jgi:hypothetical protein
VKLIFNNLAAGSRKMLVVIPLVKIRAKTHAMAQMMRTHCRVEIVVIVTTDYQQFL